MERFLVGDTSEIVIGRGDVFNDLLPARAGREKIALLSQPGAAQVTDRIVSEIGRVACHVIPLPDRDSAKTLATAEMAYRTLADLGIGRHDTVVGVGGGAATDLAGFVAATYLRGVEAVYVPTTLLGAVDASIGGKTGVNLAGKNLVGVFSHPRRVVIDLDILDALPDQFRREGMAEALKAGLIGDRDLFAHIESTGLRSSLDVVVPRAISVKVGVVNEDFREAGKRAILNYGHTIGHAVELAGDWSHGNAISVGMVAAGFLGERLEGFDAALRQRQAIQRLGLPVRAENLDIRVVQGLLARDKKRDQSGLRMVLLRGISDPVVRPVPPDEIVGGLASIGIT
jgi:3-dehydroquinate synthetase